MLAEVIAIGDELTSGQRLDTNSQWLSERLGEVGVEVRFHTTVGDDLQANIDVFRAAAERADVVVATGGLGPTADDLTRQALADAFDAPLELDEEVLEHIRQLFARRHRQMAERNALQAMFPTGATPIDNPHGTAPGIAMAVARNGRPPCRLFALPGVPAETHEMWDATVRPAVLDLQSDPLITRHRRVKCFGVGESDLEAMLPDLIARGRVPRVGITASKATLTLRVTATGPDGPACDEAMGPTLAAIRERAGDLVFGEEDEELQHVVVRLLAERGQTLAVEDNATQGLLSCWLLTADASRGVVRSAMNYHAAAPAREDQNAEAMAVRRASGSDYALLIGQPRPTGHAEDMAAAISIAGPEGCQTLDYATVGHPSLIKDRLAKQAMDLLRRRVLGLPPRR